MNKVGRPLKFNSPEELQIKIDAYFSETSEEEWTITGLALALDTYRDVLIRYEKKEEYYNTIKRAKEKVHNAYEKDLRKKGRSGDIFALKNFGWTDSKDIKLEATVTKMPTVKINSEDLEVDIR